jgi:membrane protein DedA with SNARE-associated domain
VAADLPPASRPEALPPAGRAPRPILHYAVPLGVITVGGMIGVAFWSVLLAKAPLALIALSPLFRHLVLVSPSVDALSLFAVGVPRHFLPDPIVYFMGRDYGPVAIQWMEVNSPGAGKLVRGVERLFAKVGPVALLVSPDLIVSTLAGAAKVRLSVFLTFNVLGTIGTVGVARWFGKALQGPIETLTRFVKEHLVEVTIASLVLFAVIQWLTTRRRGASPGGAES